MSRHVSSACMVLAAAAGLAAGSQHAQAQGGELVLPELIVSASRTAVQAREVGSAVTVITAEEIERRQLRLVSDLLRSVPGVAVSRVGPLGGVTQVRLRGAEGNHTLVVIDGVEVNNPIGDSEFDFSSLLTDDIERIEILRGPQSAIWGSDSIGGVVNIVTKRGRKGFRGHASAEGGSFGTYRLNAGASGGTEQARASVSGSLLETDGINAARRGSEKDGYRNGTLAVTGDVDLNRHLSVNLNGRYTRVKADTDPQPLGIVVDGDEGYRSEQIYGRAQARLTLLDGAWQQVLGAAVTRADRDNFADGATTSESTGTRGKLDYQSSLFFDTKQFADASHTLTFFVEREHEDFRNRNAAFPAADQYRDTTDYGYVGEYRVDLWERLFLSAAVRFDDNERFRDSTTYRGTAAYLFPDSGTRLHGSYGTGVTNPTFFELFGFDPGSFIGDPRLKPEKSTGWDIGVEQSFLDGRLVVDLTYFRANLEDEIRTVFLPTFQSTPVNLDGTSRRQGIEVAAKARVTDDLDLAGSFTWLDSREPSGRSEVRRPDYLASANVNYRFLEGRANLNLGVDYNGRMVDSEFDPATPRTRVNLDDFVLVNLSGAYRLTDSIELFGRVENLLDQDYEEVYSFNAPGIAAYAGVKVTFGGP